MSVLATKRKGMEPKEYSGLWLVLPIITTTWLLGDITFLQPKGVAINVLSLLPFN